MRDMSRSRIDRDGNVLHYGQVAFKGQCEYEGCRGYAQYPSSNPRHCSRHSR